MLSYCETLKTPWNDAWQQLWLVWVWIPKNLFDGKQMKGCYKCLQHWKSRDDLCQNWGAGKTKEKNGLELLSSPICGDRWHCTTVKISIRNIQFHIGDRMSEVNMVLALHVILTRRWTSTWQKHGIHLLKYSLELGILLGSHKRSCILGTNMKFQPTMRVWGFLELTDTCLNMVAGGIHQDSNPWKLLCPVVQLWRYWYGFQS